MREINSIKTLLNVLPNDNFTEGYQCKLLMFITDTIYFSW